MCDRLCNQAYALWKTAVYGAACVYVLIILISAETKPVNCPKLCILGLELVAGHEALRAQLDADSHPRSPEPRCL